MHGKVVSPQLAPIGQIYYSGSQKSPVGAGAKAVGARSLGAGAKAAAVVVGRQQSVRRQLETTEVDQELGTGT